MNEQGSHGVLKIILTLPKPPRTKGRGLDFPVFPQYILRCTHKTSSGDYKSRNHTNKVHLRGLRKNTYF
jgi:hypothetical protein